MESIEAPLFQNVLGFAEHLEGLTAVSAPSISFSDEAPCDGEHDVSAIQDGLSERELQILLCVVRGMPINLIARECAIAKTTVTVHLQMILRNIATRNRRQGAIGILGHGVVE